MNPRNFCAGLALLLSATASQALYRITIEQSGADVIFTGAGSINTAGLSISGSAYCTHPNGSHGPIATCVGASSPVNQLTGYGSALDRIYATSAPSLSIATASSGNAVGLTGRTLYVPVGYVSGAAISNSSTFSGQTLAGMGLTVGSLQTYTLPSGDRVVITVGNFALPTAAPASIPTLSEWGVIVISFVLALFGLARVRRRV